MNNCDSNLRVYGNQQQVMRRRLHDGAARRHGVTRGAGRRGHNGAVAGDAGQPSLLGGHVQPHHPRHAALGDHRVVQRVMRFARGQR